MSGVTVAIGGERYSGWLSASVTRSLDHVAGTVRLTLTDRHTPGQAAIAPGAAIAVSAGGDRVIAGYIDTVRLRRAADSAEIEVAGRDATGDLVDCSAAGAPGEWHDARLEAIVADLVRPYGVRVATTGDTGAPYRRYRIEEGETVYEAVERGCRLRGLLPMSDGRGGLVLGRPGRHRAAVTLRGGVDILSIRVESDWSRRHSTYRVLGQQTGGWLIGAARAAHVAGEAVDPGISRHRPLVVLAEQAVDDVEAGGRAQWEADVRAARGLRVTVRVAGWRERGDVGALWEPGRIVRVIDERAQLDRDLLIASVAYSHDDPGGTLATLTLAPPAAYSARPVAAPPAALGAGVVSWT